MEPITKHLALFKTKYGHIICGDWDDTNDPEYKRITGYVPVSFPLSEEEAVIQIEALAKKRDEVRQEYLDLKEKIEQKKKELFSLEHTV